MVGTRILPCQGEKPAVQRRVVDAIETSTRENVPANGGLELGFEQTQRKSATRLDDDANAQIPTFLRR